MMNSSATNHCRDVVSTRLRFVVLVTLLALTACHRVVLALPEVPPPEQPLPFPNVLYRAAWREYLDLKEDPSAERCEELVWAVERTLLEDPSACFGRDKFGGAEYHVYLVDGVGGPFGVLADLYSQLGDLNEALTLQVRKCLAIALSREPFGAGVNHAAALDLPVHCLSSAGQLASRLAATEGKAHPLLLVGRGPFEGDHGS